MELRPFRPADLQTLSEIDRACFPAGIAYSREELRNFIEQQNARTWVAVEGETVAGFVVAERTEKDVAHVITIDVVRDWRRRGVGKRLMSAAEEWARSLKARVMYLETADDNLAAQRFYEATGYRKLQKLEHYYANGAAAWVMVKALTPP